MIYFADAISFHTRNFPALYRVLRSEGVPSRYFTWADDGMKLAFGDYAGFVSELGEHIDALARVPTVDLRTHRHRNVPLFDVCRFELLHHVMTRPRWYDELGPNTEEAVFDRLAATDEDALRLNLAAAAFWVDWWRTELPRGGDGTRTVGIFGNSLSYTRALAAQATELDVLPLVFEHFFTGHDHYMEPRLSAIQGFSELRLPPPASCEPDPELVYRRLADMRNKNVQQASFRRSSAMRREPRSVLILGQVVNDFAAVAPNNPRLGTVAAYKAIVGGLLDETDVAIVFKTHPYEVLKTGNRGPVTHDELRAFVARRSPQQRARVHIVDDYPLESLFRDCDLVITLHSQGGLEALYTGLPVATLGNPFYGRKGFTRDFEEAASMVRAIAEDETMFRLGPDQERRYLTYMTHCFHVLVNRHERRERMLGRLASFGVFPTTSPPVRAPDRSNSSNHGSPLVRKARKLVSDPKLFVDDALTHRIESGGATGQLARKARKLVRSPGRFFLDALRNRTDKG